MDNKTRNVNNSYYEDFFWGGGLWKLVVISGHFQMPRAIKKTEIIL